MLNAISRQQWHITKLSVSHTTNQSLYQTSKAVWLRICWYILYVPPHIIQTHSCGGGALSGTFPFVNADACQIARSPLAVAEVG